MSSASPLRSRVPRLAGAAVEKARLSVVPRARAVRAPRVPFVLFVSAILLTGVVGLLMFNTSMQQASFAMDTYQDRSVRLAAQQEALKAELEGLRDPQTLAAKAQRQGMVRPECTAFITVGTGAVSGKACVAEKQPGSPLGQDAPTVPKILDPDPIVETVAPPPADPAAGTEQAGDAGQANKNKKKNQDRQGDRR
jgi:cell division protein FtsB